MHHAVDIAQKGVENVPHTGQSTEEGLLYYCIARKSLRQL